MGVVRRDPPAFERLPDEIIQQILEVADPDVFASLALLNVNWRRVSRQAYLYAHQLSACSSYWASHGSVPAAATAAVTAVGDKQRRKLTDEDLPRLRRLFAREVKRNLFEAYLRPKTTVIKIISNAISSSSVPGGDGLQFSPSPRGHHLLAYNSSRIYVLDVRGPELQVKRELKILRRPVSACILDDGTVLAVLSSDMQIDVYNLREAPPKRTRSMVLDHTPRAIAMSPCGSVLAAAYEGGIEVTSIGPAALPTERRAVKCDGVDSLAFSFDGTQLLGTTTVSRPPNTVILTAPYYDPGSQMGEDSVSALWTTSILFPNTSRDCSHAVLLQESGSQEASWTFTYDSSFETFRAVRIDDLRNGTTYFTGPSPNTETQPTLLPCTLPAASYCGDLVSAGFEGQDVWLYGIPEDLEAVPNSSSASLETDAAEVNRRNSTRSVRSTRVRESTGRRAPQWQMLCDKFRNTLVAGRKVTELNGVSAVKWTSGCGQSSLQNRLIVAARGIQPPKPITEEDGIDWVDGGRITILDFDYGTKNGEKTEVTIDVGTVKPEVLEEEHRDIATEVAIVRRRTVAARRGTQPDISRAAPGAGFDIDPKNRPVVPPIPVESELENPLNPRRRTAPREGESQSPVHDDPEDATLEEVQEALDGPYAHTSPRSGTTLRRAATAAAVNRRLHPPAAAAGPVEYRRADGRAEHPHESDADNWVPPPPPYSKEDPGDTPAFLRHATIPGSGLVDQQASPSVPPIPPIPSAAVPSYGPPSTVVSASQVAPRRPASSAQNTRPELPRIQTSPPPGRPASRLSLPLGRMSDADSNNMSPLEDIARTVSRSSMRHGEEDVEEDIYDVSPVDSLPPEPFEAVSHNHNRQRDYASHSASTMGTATSTSEFTPASSNLQPTSTVHSRRPSTSAAAVNFSRPAVRLSTGTWNESQAEPSSASRALPNPQTWPRGYQQAYPTPPAVTGGYPYSAPATGINPSEMLAAALPQSPRPDHLSSLNNRRDQAAVPHRVPGNFHIPRVPVGRIQPDRTSLRHSIADVRALSPDAEQPLIISTPRGISGVYDPPEGHFRLQRNATEPVMLAPTPRHPPVNLMPAPSSRPPVEHLGMMNTMASNNNISDVHARAQAQAHELNLLPVPPTTPSQLTSSSLRHHTSLTRKQSRARRSAARNVQEAKKKGWGSRGKDKDNKKKKKQKDTDGMSSAGWTDITWATGRRSAAPTAAEGQGKKSGKCVVM